MLKVAGKTEESNSDELSDMVDLEEEELTQNRVFYHYCLIQSNSYRVFYHYCFSLLFVIINYI